MKRVRDRQSMCPPPPLRQQFGGRGNRGVGTREDHGVGAIDRRDVDLIGQQRQYVSFGSGHRDHRTTRRQCRHHAAASGDHLRGVRQGQHAGHVGRGDLTDGMAGDDVGFDAPTSQQCRQGRLDGEQCGLGELGILQQRRLAAPEHLSQRQSQLRIQRRGNVVERFREFGITVVKLPSHPQPLGPLPGEHEHRLTHRADPPGDHARGGLGGDQFAQSVQ